MDAPGAQSASAAALGEPDQQDNHRRYGRSGTNSHSDVSLVLEAYRRRLTPSQFAWLSRGLGVVREVPADVTPGSLEDYEEGAGNHP